MKSNVTLATQAYCVKCKAKRDMKDEKLVTMKNGQNALSGICTVCGTKMFKIGGGGPKKLLRLKQLARKQLAKQLKLKRKQNQKQEENKVSRMYFLP